MQPSKITHPIMDTTETSSFFMHQFNNFNLSVFTYYLESEKDAILIDPLRDVQPYLDIIAERKSTLKYIFETHFHADFVSGHVELAEKTGATIVFGPTAVTKYKSYVAKDEEIIKLGKIEIKILHTPGHTLESSCFVLISEGKPFCVFTGDTLLLGDVGRPDLACKGKELQVNDLAEMLYTSIENKIKTLGDDLWVYPAHGSDSKCKIGNQKKTNSALLATSKEDFINKVTSNLGVPPPYFFFDAVINREGCESFEKVFQRENKPINIKDFEKQVEDKEILIIDTRNPDNIVKGYVPNSLGLPLQCSFTSWVGKLVKPKSNIVLVCEKGTEADAITQLIRIGFDTVAGFLDGGFESWKGSDKPINMIKLADPEEMKKVIEEKDKKVLLDVREPGEWVGGVVGEPLKISVRQLEEKLKEVPKDKEIYCYCKAGIRGLMAVTTLQKNGYTNVHNVIGGYENMKECGVPTNK